MNKRSSSAKSSNFAGVVIGSGGVGDKRKKLAVIPVVIVMLLAIAGALYLNKEELFARTICDGKNNQIYTDVVAVTKEGSGPGLNVLAEKIKQQKYKEDPSCLYAVVQSDIYGNNFDEAQGHYRMLEVAFAKKKEFVAVYREAGIKNITETKQQLGRSLQLKETINITGGDVRGIR